MIKSVYYVNNYYYSKREHFVCLAVDTVPSGKTPELKWSVLKVSTAKHRGSEHDYVPLC